MWRPFWYKDAQDSSISFNLLRFLWLTDWLTVYFPCVLGVQVMNSQSLQFTFTLPLSYGHLSSSFLSNHACPAIRGRQIPVQVVARCWEETISILECGVCCLTHRTITFCLYCWCRQITHCFGPGHCSVSSCNNNVLQTKLQSMSQRNLQQ